MFETAMDTFEIDAEFYETSRTNFNASEDISFFNSNSPPSSPRPCPISPCRSDSMSSLSMENDFVDFNSFINKDKKPFSPARKRLNMDLPASSGQSSSKPVMERPHLQTINENISPLFLRASPSLKRSDFSEDSLSPVPNKRHRGENHSPAFSSIFSPNHQQPTLRKSVSIMNVLTSSSEMLRKNRL